MADISALQRDSINSWVGTWASGGTWQRGLPKTAEIVSATYGISETVNPIDIGNTTVGFTVSAQDKSTFTDSYTGINSIVVTAVDSVTVTDGLSYQYLAYASIDEKADAEHKSISATNEIVIENSYATDGLKGSALFPVLWGTTLDAKTAEQAKTAFSSALNEQLQIEESNKVKADFVAGKNENPSLVDSYQNTLKTYQTVTENERLTGSESTSSIFDARLDEELDLLAYQTVTIISTSGYTDNISIDDKQKATESVISYVYEKTALELLETAVFSTNQIIYEVHDITDSSSSGYLAPVYWESDGGMDSVQRGSYITNSEYISKVDIGDVQESLAVFKTFAKDALDSSDVNTALSSFIASSEEYAELMSNQLVTTYFTAFSIDAESATESESSVYVASAELTSSANVEDIQKALRILNASDIEFGRLYEEQIAGYLFFINEYGDAIDSEFVISDIITHRINVSSKRNFIVSGNSHHNTFIVRK